MQCYFVKVQGKVKRWAGSMAECREVKKDLVAGGAKASQVAYEPTEVPTDKPSLLEFLNKNCIPQE